MLFGCQDLEICSPPLPASGPTESPRLCQFSALRGGEVEPKTAASHSRIPSESLRVFQLIWPFNQDSAQKRRNDRARRVKAGVSRFCFLRSKLLVPEWQSSWKPGLDRLGYGGYGTLQWQSFTFGYRPLVFNMFPLFTWDGYTSDVFTRV